MLDRSYNIKVKTITGTNYIRKLTANDFLVSSLRLSFFEMPSLGNTAFERIKAKLNIERQEKNNEKQEKEQDDYINKVLEIAVKDFEKVRKNIVYCVQERNILYNTVINVSCDNFSDTIQPDKQMVLNCHYLAKSYGGKPSNYLDLPLDKFLFNLHCLNLGTKEENLLIEKINKNPKKGKR